MHTWQNYFTFVSEREQDGKTTVFFFSVQKYKQVSDYNRICWVMNSSTNLNVPYTEHFVKMNNDSQSLSSQHKSKP